MYNNNKNYNNKSNGKKFVKKDRQSKQPKEHLILTGVELTEKMPDELYNNLAEVLEKIPFDLISVPLYTLKKNVFKEQAENTKGIMVGYVNAVKVEETEEDIIVKFDVTIYDAFKEQIKEFANPYIKVSCITEKDSLEVQTITKITILPQE